MIDSPPSPQDTPDGDRRALCGLVLRVIGTTQLVEVLDYSRAPKPRVLARSVLDGTHAWYWLFEVTGRR